MPSLKGVMRLDATEIQVFHPKSSLPGEFSSEITENYSIIYSPLAEHPAEMMGEASEALQDMFREEMLVCVCLNTTMSIVAVLALRNLSKNLIEFSH